MHSALDGLLRRYVRNQRVDYLAWRMRDRQALEDYLGRLAKVKVDDLPEREQLAFYLNLYNASMISQVLDRLSASWTPAAEGYGVFKDRSIPLGKQRISLDHLEHRILRKRFSEPRIHVALVCGAKSCPPLGSAAFTAKNLEQVLAANMRNFVRDPSRNVVDHERKRLRLSKLFEWFRADFGKDEAAIKRYVAQFLPGQPDLGDYSVGYLEYDWALNITPKAIDPVSGDALQFVEVLRDVELAPAGADHGTAQRVRAGELLRVLERTTDGYRVARARTDGQWVCPAGAVRLRR